MDNTFAISVSKENNEIFLHRKGPQNMVVATMTLNKTEAMVLLSSLLEEVDYQDKALSILMNKNIARPNHA